MLMTRVLHLLINTGMLVSQPAPAGVTPVSPDEILSYECARSVATLVEKNEQPGPVFLDGPLVFTSIQASDGTKVLILSAGSGTYAAPLTQNGVNRIRFYLPTRESVEPRLFFVSYLHDSSLRSRYFDFSMYKAPVGRDDTDFQLVRVQRADHLLQHLEYAVFETSDFTLSAFTDGRLQRDKMLKRKAEHCEHMFRKAPALARNLRRNLDALELMVLGPDSVKPAQSSRLPASVSARTGP